MNKAQRQVYKNLAMRRIYIRYIDDRLNTRLQLWEQVRGFDLSTVYPLRDIVLKFKDTNYYEIIKSCDWGLMHE